MKTTIDIPEPLYKQAKICAVQRGQTLKAIMLKALAREVQPAEKRSEKPPSFAERRKLRPGFKRLLAKGALGGGTDSTMIISEDRSSRER